MFSTGLKILSSCSLPALWLKVQIKELKLDKVLITKTLESILA